MQHWKKKKPDQDAWFRQKHLIERERDSLITGGIMEGSRDDIFQRGGNNTSY